MIASRFDRNSNPHDMQHEMRSRNKRKSDAEHNISLSCSRIIQSTGRKDRHSKVSTVKGPKDRRLRLSPKTAIQFYDLQDRLGFDRPSEAIEWLMREAKDAIDALKSRDDGHQRHNNTPEVASSSFDFDQHLDDQNCEQTYGQENHPGSDFSFFVDEDHVSSSYIDQRGTMMFSELDANWDCCNEVGNPSLGHEDQMFPRREQFHSVDTETYCQDTVDVSNESTNVDGCSTQGHLGNC